MRHFADPSRCPDCGSSLSSGSTTCLSCRLDLSGRLGHELFTTLAHADTLLAQLRQRSQPADVSTTVTTAVPPPSSQKSARPSSVPQVLLALGAVCLLVAALVFLAVTWSVLGVGGRTATLVGFTVTTAVLTTWAARRGLRGAAEALGAVTFGLAVLDLYGARNAGWLGDLSDPAMTVLVGGALVAGGLGAVGALGRTTAKGFTCGELAVVVGASLGSVGLAAQSWGGTAARLLLAVCLVLALTALVWGLVRTGSTLFRGAAWMLVPVAALDWLALAATGLDNVGAQPTMATAWVHLEAWPLLAAAVVALAIAVLSLLPLVARVVCAAAALVPLSLAALAPAADESVTVAVLALVALSVALVAVMTAAPAPWGASALAAGTFCLLGLTVVTLRLLGAGVEQYVDAVTVAWAGAPGGRLPSAALLDGEPPWLLPICVAGVTILLWSAIRLAPGGWTVRGRVVLGSAASALGASSVLMLLLYPVPVWTVLLALIVGALVPARRVLTRDSVPAAAVAAASLSAAVVLSWYDERLTAATVAVALALVATAHLRTGRTILAATSGGFVPVLLAGLVWTLGAVTGAGMGWVGLVGLLLLTALVLGRPPLPAGVRAPGVQAVLELAVACSAGVLGVVALDAVADADRSTWLAVYLTVAGAAATAVSVLRRDRREVAWLGGLLLAAATWVRLADIGVEQPEPYTLPTALALLVVGLLRLRRDGTSGTHEALGAGLLLALVPSLLWVASEPGGLRSVLLGLGCLGLIVGGAQWRWVAPFAYGAAVGLVVVLVEAGPHVGDAVPRWALIGAAGALLIALGVTWEQRLSDARSVSSYFRAMR